MHETLRDFLNQTLGAADILSSSPLSGGDINEVVALETTQGTFCVKRNSKHAFPGMFEAEAKGLQALKMNSPFHVPDVLGVCEDEQHQYLILEFIQEGNERREFNLLLGEMLADMHRHSQDTFGLDHDNYIGSLPQHNTLTKTWAGFYAEQRILPQLKQSVDSKLLSPGSARQCERLCEKFDQLFPVESPALLHGDLWSGNYMIDANGTPCLIDPAVYYGHREMDLGMMLLFGGFSNEVFNTYQEVFPLEQGWKERVPLTQLYPLFVHVNLFGGGYVQKVEAIVRSFA